MCALEREERVMGMSKERNTQASSKYQHEPSWGRSRYRGTELHSSSPRLVRIPFSACDLRSSVPEHLSSPFSSSEYQLDLSRVGFFFLILCTERSTLFGLYWLEAVLDRLFQSVPSHRTSGLIVRPKNSCLDLFRPHLLQP